MARKLYPDKWLFAATVGLALFGVVMVYSASAVMAQRENGNQFHYVVKQGIWTGIGFVVMLAAMQIDYKHLKNRRVVYGLLAATTVMLLAVFAFPAINGAHRWIKLPGLSIQPSELSEKREADRGGNIGTSLITLVESSREEGWTVVELSSYQLETIKEFHPAVAVVLNVTPNHMDRYEAFTDYAAAKHRIFMNQEPGDVAVLNGDDELVSSWASGLRAHVVTFSVRHELQEGLFLRGHELVSRTRDGERALMKRDQMKLRGLHNVENVLAALSAGLACGANPESMRETVSRFQPVEHRLELVASINGVKFYNDSKATSVDATVKALEAFQDEAGKVILILGGRGKHAPYSPLAELVRDHVRQLVLIGEDAETIAKDLGEYAPSQRAADMQEAVKLSFQSAEPGDIVLLAPACASFDMFESFEHRGKVFKAEVSSLEFRVSSQEQDRSPELETRNPKLETTN